MFLVSTFALLYINLNFRAGSTYTILVFTFGPKKEDKKGGMLRLIARNSLFRARASSHRRLHASPVALGKSVVANNSMKNMVVNRSLNNNEKKHLLGISRITGSLAH